MRACLHTEDAILNFDFSTYPAARGPQPIAQGKYFHCSIAALITGARVLDCGTAERDEEEEGMAPAR